MVDRFLQTQLMSLTLPSRKPICLLKLLLGRRRRIQGLLVGVASTLIAGATSQISVELSQTKLELAQLRNKHEVLANTLSDVRIQKAVLAERIDAFRLTRHLKNIGIAVGTLLVGVGVQLVRSDATMVYGVASILVGALLVLPHVKI